MIRAEHIFKSFDGRTVLDDISVEFETGKTNLIIGRSGSGKTVLLKTLVGLHEPDSGDVWYDDIRYTALGFKERKAIRKDIGMIFQGGALLDSSTVAENIRLPLDLFTDQSEAEKRERVDFCLRRVRLENADDLYPSELSGGMIKRVAIARAIVLNPRYLFCDEPNSGLDPQTSIVIDNLIHEITEEYNITTIINTHDMNSVMEIGQKIVYIYKGRKWWEGTKEDILHTDNRELNDFVFASAMAVCFAPYGRAVRLPPVRRQKSKGSMNMKKRSPLRWLLRNNTHMTSFPLADGRKEMFCDYGCRFRSAYLILTQRTGMANDRLTRSVFVSDDGSPM